MRFEQNGGILRALLIFGTAIGMTMTVGINPVTGTTDQLVGQASRTGEMDCLNGNPFNPNQPAWLQPANSGLYRPSYEGGWEKAGCKVPPS